MYSLWALTDVHTCEIKIQNVFTIFKRSCPCCRPCLLGSWPQASTPCFVSLFSPLLEVHIHAFTFYVAFCVWFCTWLDASEIHHVVACVSSLLLVDGYPCCELPLCRVSFICQWTSLCCIQVLAVVDKLSKMFSKVVVCSHRHVWEFQLFPFLLTFVIVGFLSVRPNGCVMVSYCGLNLHVSYD